MGKNCVIQKNPEEEPGDNPIITITIEVIVDWAKKKFSMFGKFVVNFPRWIGQVAKGFWKWLSK